MIRLRILVVFSALVGMGISEDCNQAIKTFFECKHGNEKDGFKKCFMDNSCTPPPKPDEDGPNGNDECGKAIHKAVGEKVKECMKNKGVDIPDDYAGGPPHHGPGGPPHHGPPSPPPNGGPSIEQMAKDNCDGNTKNAQRVKTCLDALHIGNGGKKPSKQEAEQWYEAKCKAEESCTLSNECQNQLHTHGKARCECDQEIHSKIEEIVKGLSQCQNAKKPQHPPNGPPPNGDKHDCSKPPPFMNICKEGFDTWFANMQNGHPPPPDQ